MGYSPWSHKESDTTEQLSTLVQVRGHRQERVKGWRLLGPEEVSSGALDICFNFIPF